MRAHSRWCELPSAAPSAPPPTARANASTTYAMDRFSMIGFGKPWWSAAPIQAENQCVRPHLGAAGPWRKCRSRVEASASSVSNSGQVLLSETPCSEGPTPRRCRSRGGTTNLLPVDTLLFALVRNTPQDASRTTHSTTRRIVGAKRRRRKGRQIGAAGRSDRHSWTAASARISSAGLPARTRRIVATFGTQALPGQPLKIPVGVTAKLFIDALLRRGNIQRHHVKQDHDGTGMFGEVVGYGESFGVQFLMSKGRRIRSGFIVGPQREPPIADRRLPVTIASSARFSRSTLTPGSPRTPRSAGGVLLDKVAHLCQAQAAGLGDARGLQFRRFAG